MCEFLAGFLFGLFVWGAAEFLRLFRSADRSRREGTLAAAVFAADTGTKDLEYRARRARAELAGAGFGKIRVIVADRGLDGGQRALLERLEDVRVVREEELPLSLRPERDGR